MISSQSIHHFVFLDSLCGIPDFLGYLFWAYGVALEGGVDDFY